MAKQNGKGAVNTAPKAAAPAPAANANADQKTPEQIAADQAAAEERAALIQKLTELKFPTTLDDLSLDELRDALKAVEQAQANAGDTPANNEPKTSGSTTGSVKPIENKLQNVADVANKEKVPALWIRSVPESFMRCGRRFTREGYGIALDVLTEEEIQRLKDEPNLVVEEVDALID